MDHNLTKEPPGELILFGKRDSVIQVEKDGTVTADVSRAKNLAARMGIPKLSRFYTEVRPQIMKVLEMIDAVTVKKFKDREATRLPIATHDGEPTGQELMIKPTFSKTVADDEMLEEAQKTIRAEKIPCNIITRERCLLLDDLTMMAFNISEEKLKQYGDKIRILSKRADMNTIKKAAKVGGVGGDLINRALTETKGRTAVYVVGKADKVTGPDDDLGGTQ